MNQTGLPFNDKLTKKADFSVSRLFCAFTTSQERFELPTDGLEGRCSIQLSYWDMMIH